MIHQQWGNIDTSLNSNKTEVILPTAFKKYCCFGYASSIDEALFANITVVSSGLTKIIIATNNGLSWSKWFCFGF